MIYTCQTKGCHFIFLGGEQQTSCPDCGKRQIRPAARAERMEYFRRHTERLTAKKRLG